MGLAWRAFLWVSYPTVSSRVLFLLPCALLLAPAVLAKSRTAPVAAQPAEPALDVSDVKDKLQVFTDGKQHYVVVEPWDKDQKHLYYGDGKRFHSQRTHSGGREGNVAWDRTLWEPRVGALWQGGVGMRKGGPVTVQCGDRKTELEPVEGDERAKLLAEATFHAPLWKHRPYSLARDEKGIYYFVDRPREPENNKAFRLFAGPRGSLKPLKMTNVVSDSQGDIFTTKRGELRLVLDKRQSKWIAGKKETELTSLPLEDNRIMIYSDLGVYAGQRLGTPCDDML
jgi:hypothetical protein